MNDYPPSLILLILAAVALASCGGHAREKSPVLQLQVKPIPSVYIHYDSRSSIFRIGNEMIERRVMVNTETRRVSTIAFINKLSGRDYIRSPSDEFSFRANGTKLSGISGDFEYIDHETFSAGSVKGLSLALRAKREDVGILQVNLVYEIYPHTPVIRKWVEIENPGGSLVTIDSIQVESLSMMPGVDYDLEIYDGQRSPVPSPVIFDTHLTEGFFTGNESPGLLKYSDLYSDRSFISIGMKPYFRKYAPEIQLMPDEGFTSPAVFVLLFKGEPEMAEKILEEFIADYIARSKTPDYSVWYEKITADITEQEAREKIGLAARSGADIFCLDGEWMDKRGDWWINEKIAPEKIGQHTLQTGMKFGLSIELAVADPDSQIVADYPQWVVKSKDGSDYNVPGGKMMCLGSEYSVHAAHRIDVLVQELALGYIRLTGPIIPAGESSGCFAEDHIHRSGNESLWYIYEGFFAICEHLHGRHPDLIIDVSLKSYNPGGSVDYALLRCADVKWPF